MKDLDLSFTKRELAGAQARIVQLDSEISDKDKRIKILLETVKNYETNESTRIYNKYFPGNSPHPDLSSCSTGAQKPKLCHSCCINCKNPRPGLFTCSSLCVNHSCPGRCSSSQHQSCNPNIDSNHGAELKESLRELTGLLNELKLAVNQVKSTINLPINNPNLDNVDMPDHTAENVDQTTASEDSLIIDEAESILNLN